MQPMRAHDKVDAARGKVHAATRSAARACTQARSEEGLAPLRLPHEQRAHRQGAAALQLMSVCPVETSDSRAAALQLMSVCPVETPDMREVARKQLERAVHAPGQ